MYFPAKLDTTPIPVEHTSQKVYTTETFSKPTKRFSTTTPSVIMYTDATDFSSTPIETPLVPETTTIVVPTSSGLEVTDSLTNSTTLPTTTTTLSSPTTTDVVTRRFGSLTERPEQSTSIISKENQDTIGYTTSVPNIRVTSTPKVQTTEMFYTTTVRPKLTTQKPTSPPRKVTTPVPKTTTSKDKFLPKPSLSEDDVISYNIQPDANASVDTSKKPLIVVLDNDIIPPEASRKDNVNPRNQVGQRFTVPVRVTTPGMTYNEVSRDNAQRYVYVERSKKRMNLQDDDVKMHNSYKYTPEQGICIRLINLTMLVEGITFESQWY